MKEVVIHVTVDNRLASLEERVIEDLQQAIDKGEDMQLLVNGSYHTVMLDAMEVSL